ncbi:MAG: ABC transporter ATP-binding protein [bacterium]|nr:ABC transporter ATP-binding protein [bacterium]
MKDPNAPIAVSGRRLTKVYGEPPVTVVALSNVSVDFAAGRFTAIMGPSGSGKSTLLHVLAGLDTLSSGQVILGDTDITALGDTELTLFRRRNIGFVFQSFNLVPMYTAAQNILLPCELAGTKHDQGWFDTLVDVLGIGSRLGHFPSELSGGQQQRVAIARALISRPRVVFADEPTGDLDSRAGQEVLALLRSSVRELGQTVVMVTHDPLAASYADEVVLLADGRVAGSIEDPSTEAVLTGLDALRTLDGVSG